MSFVQLHLHTHIGSQLDGVGDPSEYAKLAKKKGHPAVAVTDHGKMNAFFKHQRACLSEGVKPIFGVEAYVEFELERFDEVKTDKRVRNENMHLIILAKNEIGYRNLLKLNYLSMSDEKHFYYRNHILIKEIFEHKEGLIIGSGCGNSPFNKLFRKGEKEKAEKLYKMFVDEFGDDFYTELHISELIDGDYNQKEVNKFELEMAKKYNRLVVMAGDVHYDLPGKDQIQTLAIAIRNRDNIENLSFELESKNLYYHDIEDYKKFNKQWDYGYTDKQIDEWCVNTLKVAEKINFLMPERTRMILPYISEDDDDLIIKKAKEGLIKRFGVSSYEECPEEYRNRLSTELKVIIRKGMSSYVLILEDIFRFADKEHIMRGPARGSGGGSLLLYALDITTLDPIKYDLIFERFLSSERSPDVTFDWFGEVV
jgi:DNA polymerase-3 subunit alpha